MLKWIQTKQVGLSHTAVGIVVEVSLISCGPRSRSCGYFQTGAGISVQSMWNF